MRVLGCVACILIGMATPAWAQKVYPSAYLQVLSPCGGQRGTTVEVTMLGNDLDELDTVVFSHPGLTAKRLPDPPAPEKPDPKAPPPPIRYAIGIAPDTPPGAYDVRVMGKWGVSNPRLFVVGTLREHQEIEPNNDVPEAKPIESDSTVTGNIQNRTDVDYYRFSGRKGERLLATCQATSIDSRLTPDLRLFDDHDLLVAKGRPMSDGDVLLDCRLPADGDYLLRLSETAYLHGGPEYFYRLSLSRGPVIDAVYPPVVAPGQTAQVEVIGRNLPGGKIETMDGQVIEKLTTQVTAPKWSGSPTAFPGSLPPAAASIDGFPFRLDGKTGPSNPVLLGFAKAPVRLDNQANGSMDTAQTVDLPCELCGRLGSSREQDWYRFTAAKGQVLSIEGFADRLGSALNLYLVLRRVENGQILGEYDDHPEIPQSAGMFFTYTSDPKALVTVPADGEYQLMVGTRSVDRRVAARLIYRVRLCPPEPDFRLLVVGNANPAAVGCIVRQGASEDLQLVCIRQDGFQGPVTVEVAGLPEGVDCPPQVVGRRQRDTRLVLTAAEEAPPWTGPLQVTGKAMVNGQQIRRTARIGCQVWGTNQQNNIRIPAPSRLAGNLHVAVAPKGPFAIRSKTPEVAVPVGGRVQLKYQLKKYDKDFKANVQCQGVSEARRKNGQEVNMPNFNLPADEKEQTVQFNLPNDTLPGEYNLVFRGFAQFPYQRTEKKKENVTVYQSTPPVKLTVYDRFADVVLAPAEVRVAPGQEVGLMVELKRLHGYDGELVVELVAAKDHKDVSAAKVKVAADANRAELKLKAKDNAKPTERSEYQVRVAGKLDRAQLSSETPLLLSVPAAEAEKD